MEFLEYLALAAVVGFGWFAGRTAHDTAVFWINVWLNRRSRAKWVRENPEEAATMQLQPGVVTEDRSHGHYA
jgi:hypothetical protein